MKHHVTYFVLVCLLFSLVSCDPTVDYDRIIQNNSDHELVYYFDQVVEYDTVHIPPKSEVIIYSHHGLGTVSSYENCDQVIFEIERLIVADSAFHLKYDGNDPDQWEFIVIDKDAAGGGECECRLVVKNEDIE